MTTAREHIVMSMVKQYRAALFKMYLYMLTESICDIATFVMSLTVLPHSI